MDAIELSTGGSVSKIFIENSIEKIENVLPNTKVIVVIDESVCALYADLLEKYPAIKIHADEKAKTLETVYQIYKKLVELEADRHTFLLGIGGGITCDISGYVASTYMRGIRFGFIATSLMAQVDAAIGGKNGVNFQGYKNVIGSFNLPDFVGCDLRALTTLPPREYNAGFAEIVKYGLIQDATILKDLEDNIEKFRNKELKELSQLISKCVRIKVKIVNSDIKENGVRKILNFGHTIGHAIEKITSDYNHGEALSIGMMWVLKFLQNKAIIPESDVTRICKILQLFDLPTSINPQFAAAIVDAIKLDKKRNNELFDFVTLTTIGNATVLSISVDALNDEITNILN